MQDYSLGPEVIGDHHYALLEHVLGLNPEGVAVEFGVGKGESTALIAEHMPVIGFDSWLGLPENWRPGFPKGSFAAMPPTIPGVELVDGWYEDSLPDFDFTPLTIGLLHIDCDLYESTATALKYVGPHLKAGAIVVFDEWHGFIGAERFERRAWREYATNLSWRVLGHGHQQWGIQLV